MKVEGRKYLRLDSCLVIPPPDGRKPKALVKFLGGAFIGAVPEVTYRFDWFRNWIGVSILMRVLTDWSTV